MKTTSQISKLSKDGKSRYFRPRDIMQLSELCARSGLDIQFGSPLVLIDESWYEMYWLPHKFMIDSRTGKPIEDLSKAKRLILEGVQKIDWVEEIKGLPGLLIKLKKNELSESQLLDSIWIEVSLV